MLCIEELCLIELEYLLEFKSNCSMANESLIFMSLVI